MMVEGDTLEWGKRRRWYCADNVDDGGKCKWIR